MNIHYESSPDITVAVNRIQEFVWRLLNDNKKIFALYFVISSTYNYQALIEVLKIKLPYITCFGTMTDAIIVNSITMRNGFAVFAFTDDIIEDMLITSVTSSNATAVEYKIQKYFNLKSLEKVNDNEGYVAMLITDFSAFRDNAICELINKILPNVSYVGGASSIGYGLLQDTKVFLYSGFAKNTGLLAIMKSKAKVYRRKICPIEIMFHTKAKITDFNIETNTIKSINNIPAAEFYCNIIGLDIDNIASECIVRDYTQDYPIVLETNEQVKLYDVLKINRDDMSIQLVNKLIESTNNIFIAIFEDINDEIESKLHSFLSTKNRENFYSLCFASSSIYSNLFRTREIANTLNFFKNTNLIGQTCSGEYCKEAVNHTMTFLMFEQSRAISSNLEQSRAISSNLEQSKN